MLCQIHNAEMKQIPAGISKKTGKPYDSFYACQIDGCKWRPQETSVGWSSVREQVAAKVAPEKAVMTKEDWEEKERRTNKNILLQVAFKAAVELAVANKLDKTIEERTLYFYNWLLSQTEGQKSVSVSNLKPSVYIPEDDVPLPEPPPIQ